VVQHQIQCLIFASQVNSAMYRTSHEFPTLKTLKVLRKVN